MTIDIRYSLFMAMLLLSSIIPTKAQTATDPYPDYLEETFMDMDFEPNLLTPPVPKTVIKEVAAYQKKTALGLKSKILVDIMRDDDVFVATIPTDDLFLPNDTLLHSYAARKLDIVAGLMKDPYMYKVVIAIHTDDTGSEYYREKLSLARLNSIYDWIMDAIDEGTIPEEIVIIPFSMGSNEPLVANDTRKHRKENRRLEFYFIPGPKMIELAKEHLLK